MLLYVISVMLCLLQSAHSKDMPNEGRFTDKPKTYATETRYVCGGDSYKLRCGTGTGPRVLNLTRIHIIMHGDTEAAYACNKTGTCAITMGEDGDDVTAPSLLHLYKSIQHYCQGKPKCRRILPTYDRVKVQFPKYSYNGTCGRYKNEYMAVVKIFATCVELGTVPELPPYKYFEKLPPPVTKATLQNPSTTVSGITDIPKIYQTKTQYMCSGERYEVGCGTGTGPRVMKLTEVHVLMSRYIEASVCDKERKCYIKMDGGGDVVTAQPLLNLYKSILHNCQGRSWCQGVLPLYDEVKVQHSRTSYNGRCGWAKNEYLTMLRIITKCVEPGTVDILPPYEYEDPSAAAQISSTETAAAVTTAPPQHPTTINHLTTTGVMNAFSRISEIVTANTVERSPEGSSAEPDLPKVYLPETEYLCGGDRYELGCGTGSGARVLSLAYIFILMDSVTEAIQCTMIGRCSIMMAEYEDVGITAKPLRDLYKSILDNCQGKSKCEGVLPTSRQVKVQFPEGFYRGLCGWIKNEYLSGLKIATVCVAETTAAVTTAPPQDLTPTNLLTTTGVVNTFSRVSDKMASDTNKVEKSTEASNGVPG